jgi:predicted acyltransferase
VRFGVVSAILLSMRTETAQRAEPPIAAQSAASARLISLDAFRGITVAAMLLVNNPGSDPVYPQLEHAAWNGWTFTDTIFPFFLWIVGVSMTLSFAKRMDRGANRNRLLLHAVRRSAIIYILGLLLAGFPYFHLEHIRVVGVLPRIAVCYLVASALFLFTDWRGQLTAIASLFVSYWLLMALYPVPGLGAGHMEKGANFAAYVDQLFLQGHMWGQTKTWDPEGIVSTLPAIGTTLLGVIAGHILRAKKSKVFWLAGSGVILLALGELLSLWMPINKSLWTVPYTLLMAGLATLEFLFLYWLVDVKMWRNWAKPFLIFGSNAIAVFVLSGLAGRLLGLIKVVNVFGQRQSLGSFLYSALFAPLASQMNASLLYAISFVGLLFLAAWFLYSRKWFLRV